MNRYLLSILITVSPIYIIMSLLTPVWSNFVNHVGGNIRDAGIAYSVGLWATALFLVIVPNIQKKYNISNLNLALFGLVMECCLPLAYLFVHHIWQLYLAQLIFALMVASQVPSMLALYQHHLKPEYSSRGWGINKAARSFAAGIGAIIGSHIIYYFGYRNLFLIMFGIALFNLLLGILLRIFMQKSYDKEHGNIHSSQHEEHHF